VLFLRTQGKGGGARCAFASAPASAAASARTRTRSTSSSPRTLRCTLGKEGMPLACALYPLGAFLPQDAQQPALLPALYSEDDAGSCEGLGPAGAAAGAAPVPVSAYLARGGLPPRLATAAWWQSLATAWACSGIEEDVGALGPGALPPAAWREAAAVGGSSGSGSSSSSSSTGAAAGGGGLPSPFLRALRERVRVAWYSTAEPWQEGESEGRIERQTLALYEQARAALAQ
jgi:hypothetical protein